MSRRHYNIPQSSGAELLIDCPLDETHGLQDLVSGQYIVGKATGDVVWDSNERAYQFKTKNTSQGRSGVYLENINLPSPFDWNTYQYHAEFDCKRLNNSGSAFVCNAFWYAGSLNRCDAPVYVYYSGGNEINLGDSNWHHIDVVWTPTDKDEYMDGNYVMSEAYTSVTWSRRPYLVYDKYMICGTPFSTSGVGYMKNIKVWREKL